MKIGYASVTGGDQKAHPLRAKMHNLGSWNRSSSQSRKRSGRRPRPEVMSSSRSIGDAQFPRSKPKLREAPMQLEQMPVCERMKELGQKYVQKIVQEGERGDLILSPG